MCFEKKMLHFVSPTGDDKTKLKGGALPSKDSCLSLFQGLGRILYKKGSFLIVQLFSFVSINVRLDVGEDPTDLTKSYPEVTRQKGKSSWPRLFQNLIEQCHVAAPTFIGFLFENYLDFYSLMEDTERLCDYLSVADHIVHEWEVSDTKSIGRSASLAYLTL